jgi:hypothetical protein
MTRRRATSARGNGVRTFQATIVVAFPATNKDEAEFIMNRYLLTLQQSANAFARINDGIWLMDVIPQRRLR